MQINKIRGEKEDITKTLRRFWNPKDILLKVILYIHICIRIDTCI